ncbi:MAG: hypothetical protein IJT51_03325 [Bacteroidales bacterium]|nr:hypothetical protein [Bacteroidales bacterium]
MHKAKYIKNEGHCPKKAGAPGYGVVAKPATAAKRGRRALASHGTADPPGGAIKKQSGKFKLSCYNNCHEEEFFNEKDF